MLHSPLYALLHIWLNATDIRKVMNVSAVSRQDTNKTIVAARSQQRMQYSVRVIITFLFATFAQFAAIFLVSSLLSEAGKMVAVDIVAGQFEDAVEDQLLITLNGKRPTDVVQSTILMT